jgi:hypothetical protein
MRSAAAMLFLRSAYGPHPAEYALAEVGEERVTRGRRINFPG